MIQIGDVLRLLGSDKQGLSPRGAQAKAAFADYLRANQTPAERMFARVLHHVGIKAAPQMPVCGFIVDFLDEQHRVVFEVDGPIHEGREAQDRVRDEALQGAGYRVMHISNDGVRQLLANVAAARGVA
jgi:very-short-patch-repair endonuclease